MNTCKFKFSLHTCTSNYMLFSIHIVQCTLEQLKIYPKNNITSQNKSAINKIKALSPYRLTKSRARSLLIPKHRNPMLNQRVSRDNHLTKTQLKNQTFTQKPHKTHTNFTHNNQNSQAFYSHSLLFAQHSSGHSLTTPTFLISTIKQSYIHTHEKGHQESYKHTQKKQKTNTNKSRKHEGPPRFVEILTWGERERERVGF